MNHSPRCLLASRFLLAPALALAALVPNVAAGQAHKETAIQAMRLQLYGMGSYVHPQYGGQQTAVGFGVGGAVGFTLHHVHRIEPALDARYIYNTNNDLTQTFFGGGLRVTYHAARFHPYGDIMYGAGNADFKVVSPAYPNYKKDNSNVYMIGGGLDYDLTQAVAFRADFQQQHWRFAERNQPFYPTLLSVGVRYQFHFRNKYGPE